MRRTSMALAFASIVVFGSAASTAAADQPEFTSPYPNPFTVASGTTILKTVEGFKVTCASDSGAGEITGPHTAKVTLTFRGCGTGVGPSFGSCQQFDRSEGELVTQPLEVTLGYANLNHTKAGLDLSNPTGEPLAAFFCGEDTAVEILGSVIGGTKQINEPIAAGEYLKLTFSQREGHQTIRKLFGFSRDVPMVNFVFFDSVEECGIASRELLRFAQPVEIHT